MKNILITGGAGFIGSHLAERLTATGHSVTALDDLSTGSEHNLKTSAATGKLKLHRGSILDRVLVADLVASADEVYHLAAVVGVDLVMKEGLRLLEVNVDGGANVLKACAEHNKPCFLASTSEVYGKSAAIPYRETDDTVLGATAHHRWAYACTKQLDEFLLLALVREKGLRGVVGRFFNTVGPRQSPQYGMVIPRLVTQALKDEDLTVFGDGTQSRCFGHVQDVVGAVIKLMETPAAQGQVVNLGGNEEITINELAHQIIEVTHSKSRVVHIPYERAYGRGYEDMKRRKPDLTLIGSLIGYRPTKGASDIIRDTVDYVRQQTPGARV